MSWFSRSVSASREIVMFLFGCVCLVCLGVFEEEELFFIIVG